MSSALRLLTTGMLLGTPRSTEIECVGFICLRRSTSITTHSTKQSANIGKWTSRHKATISLHLWDGQVLRMTPTALFRLNLVSSKMQWPTQSRMAGDMTLCIQPTGSGTPRKTTSTTSHGKVTQHPKRITTEILVFKLIM